VTSERGIGPMLHTLALLVMLAGAAVVVYGIGCGVVKHDQYRRYEPKGRYYTPPKSYLDQMNRQLEQQWNQLEAHVENQRRTGSREKATEKAIHISAVGGLIFLVGVGLMVVAKKAPIEQGARSGGVTHQTTVSTLSSANQGGQITSDKEICPFCKEPSLKANKRCEVCGRQKR